MAAFPIFNDKAEELARKYCRRLQRAGSRHCTNKIAFAKDDLLENFNVENPPDLRRHSWLARAKDSEVAIAVSCCLAQSARAFHLQLPP
jgi:hypothetical protein